MNATTTAYARRPGSPNPWLLALGSAAALTVLVVGIHLLWHDVPATIAAGLGGLGIGWLLWRWRHERLAVGVRQTHTMPPAPTDPDPAVVRPEGYDDLTALAGIGPVLERQLNKVGVTTFADLAALDDDGIDRLQAMLPEFAGRVRTDDWVGQAATRSRELTATSGS